MRCWRGIRPWVLAVAVVALGVGALWHSRFGFSLVVGESMQPTFATGELHLIDKRAFLQQEPQRGDIVVARYLGDWIVKRVVGLPGEDVQVLKGAVWVNGASIPENYRTQSGELRVESGRLRDGRFALLGDNRDLPAGQSVHAVISKDQLVGKVVSSFPIWRTRERVGEVALVAVAHPAEVP